MDSVVKITRIEAVQLYECVKIMTGGPNYQLLRQDVLSKIEKVWPEILITGSPTEAEEVRQISIDAREQRSLAEGFVTLFNKKDEFGVFVIDAGNFRIIQKATKIAKVWNWVRSQIEKEEILEFDGELDDEPPISDDAFVFKEELKKISKSKKKSSI